MSNELASLGRAVETHGAVVRVTVFEAQGSAPRDAGAWMLVWQDGTQGTIGGGRLEYEAIDYAQKIFDLATHSRHGEAKPLWQRTERLYPLGPGLGQCCGGAVRLLFEQFTVCELGAMEHSGGTAQPCGHGVETVPSAQEKNRGPHLWVRPARSGVPLLAVHGRKGDYAVPLPVAQAVKEMAAGLRPRQLHCLRIEEQSDGNSAALSQNLTPAGKASSCKSTRWIVEPVGAQKTPLYLYGAGHVGRAIADLMAPLPFDLYWVDTARARFPEILPAHASPLLAATPADIVRHCPAGAFHLVLTFSHAIDLAICRALLGRDDFGFLGLIGSKTKRARFIARLRADGITDSALNRLTCPIGAGRISGKEPAIIALSVAAQLIERLELQAQDVDNLGQRGANVHAKQ